MSKHKRPETVRLSWRRQIGVFGGLGILLASGLVWLYLDHFVRIPGEFGLVKSPVEPLLMKIHGAFAMIILTVMGTLFPIHIKGAWHRDRNRMSGLGMATVMAIMVVTGYGLYYAAGEEMRHMTSLIHWITGVAVVPILGFHIWVGKRSAGRRKSAHDSIKLFWPQGMKKTNVEAGFPTPTNLRTCPDYCLAKPGAVPR